VRGTSPTVTSVGAKTSGHGHRTRIRASSPVQHHHGKCSSMAANHFPPPPPRGPTPVNVQGKSRGLLNSQAVAFGGTGPDRDNRTVGRCAWRVGQLVTQR